jgi:hypothetical protein
MRTRIRDFERVTGLSTDIWSLTRSAEAIKAAQALAGFDLVRMAATLSGASEALLKAVTEIAQAKGDNDADQTGGVL